MTLARVRGSRPPARSSRSTLQVALVGALGKSYLNLALLAVFEDRQAYRIAWLVVAEG